jgi:hypothetical protein
MGLSKAHIVVFGGPSLPEKFSSSSVVIRPPAVHGDFEKWLKPSSSIVVLLDGGFLQSGAITHRELGDLLQSGVVLVGAASFGALRAAELRFYGMIGIGIVYQAVLEGIVVDDAELAVGVCPTSFKALTIPMINLRRFLFDALQEGFPRSAVESAWRLAAEVYFLSRTPAALLECWNTKSTRGLADLFKRRPMSAWNVKEMDAIAAIEYAESSGARKDVPPAPSTLDLLVDPLPGPV